MAATTVDPKLAEDLVVGGERILKRSRPTDHAEIEGAVVWLLDVIRRELRPMEVSTRG